MLINMVIHFPAIQARTLKTQTTVTKTLSILQYAELTWKR